MIVCALRIPEPRSMLVEMQPNLQRYRMGGFVDTMPAKRRQEEAEETYYFFLLKKRVSKEKEDRLLWIQKRRDAFVR